VKKQITNLIAIACVTAMPELSVHGNDLDLQNFNPIFTNAVATFISEIEKNNFSLTSVKFSHGQIPKQNNQFDTISGADLLFNNNNHKIISATIEYSETEFTAVQNFMAFVEATYAGGVPPTNTTYQTDFTVLSDYNYGVATKHAFAILLSTNLVAEVNTSFDDGDSSQDMIQVIKKVETMRDAMSAEK